MATKLIWRRVKPWGVQVGRTLNVHERHRSESQPDRLPIEARRFCWVQSRPSIRELLFGRDGLDRQRMRMTLN
jgi:hypothetical protein